MIEISLNNIKKSFGFNNIIDGLSLDISVGDKVAIIGENGCGKSTLLKMIAGVEETDTGSISIRKGSTIGYLHQDYSNIDDDTLVKDVLYESIKDILEIESLMKKYEVKMNEDPNNMSIINKYLNVQEKYISAGGYEINTLIDKISHGLNIDSFIDKRFKELSGGEQKRVLLASLMIKKPNVLMLDEPTNHLDIDTLEWLESYLNKYEGTVILVSHDRYFLDKIVTKTILIENGKEIIFHGNYSYYKVENEARIDREFKEYKDQQKIIQAMKKKIKQLEEWGKLAYPGGEPFFKRAENIRKRLERMDKVDRPIIKKELPINLDYKNRSGVDSLVIKDYDLYINDRLLISNINIDIQYGEHICIIGSNGCGKTTLLKNIINNTSDKIKLGSNVKIGYIPQQIEFDDKFNVLEYARKFFDGEDYQLRSALDKFYFHGENVFKKINKLSGGEKVRLKLFELINNKSNFIILDEPTNHIDIFTKETLETALKDYTGTLLFISHDRYFINQLADRVLYINNKEIVSYQGNYDYFIEHKK